MDIRECIEKRFLAKIQPAPDLMQKEMERLNMIMRKPRRHFLTRTGNGQ